MERWSWLAYLTLDALRGNGIIRSAYNFPSWEVTWCQYCDFSVHCFSYNGNQEVKHQYANCDPKFCVEISNHEISTMSTSSNRIARSAALGVYIPLLAATLAMPTEIHAAALINPVTFSVRYDVPPNSPAATDICFVVAGLANLYNTYNTVSLDLAHTGLGGHPVDVFSALTADYTSREHPGEICFFFPATPIQPGETLLLTTERGANPPPAPDQPARWTFAQDIGEFEFARSHPPALPPVEIAHFNVLALQGPIEAQELHPFPLHAPVAVETRFEDGTLFTRTVPEPGTLSLAFVGALAAAFGLRRRRHIGNSKNKQSHGVKSWGQVSILFA